MNTNSLNLVIDGYGFAILVADGSATLFDSLDSLKRYASDADIDLSAFECQWAYELSPALLAKYGLECGSPKPEQPEGQPLITSKLGKLSDNMTLSTETVDNFNQCSNCGFEPVHTYTRSEWPDILTDYSCPSCGWKVTGELTP